MAPIIEATWEKLIPSGNSNKFIKHLKLIRHSLTDRYKHFHFIIKLLISLSVIAVLVAAVVNYERIGMIRSYLHQSTWGFSFLMLGSISVAINILALIWRAVLFWQYSPASTISDEQLPPCTVIVPAYNEGRQVLFTLRSLAASDYPSEKLRIIAVDDGSIDDTWHWIRKGSREFDGMIKTIKLPANKGKRHALYAGFQRSSGKILITVDSDSEVTPQTLRCLVSPFVQNRQVGAVAGNVRVLNRSEGLIPRMLDIVFLFSFDFIRASQSMVNTVMCTPGALSAYRSDIIMKVMDEWVKQTFCGQPANIGEDRALTNAILREGYHVRFQQNATVYTNVPSCYKNLCKMFLRWARSNVRETLVMISFAFRKFREESMLGARINLLLSILSLTTSQLFLAATLLWIVWFPLEFGLNVLIGIIIMSSLSAALYCWRCRSTEGVWAYLYGFFWFVSLSWITPYALFTPHRSGWLTR